MVSTRQRRKQASPKTATVSPSARLSVVKRTEASHALAGPYCTAPSTAQQHHSVPTAIATRAAAGRHGLVAFSPSHGMRPPHWQGHERRCPEPATANAWSSAANPFAQPVPRQQPPVRRHRCSGVHPVFFSAHTTPALVMTPPPTPAAIAHAALCDAGLAHDSILWPWYKSMSCSRCPPVFCTTPTNQALFGLCHGAAAALLLSPPVAQVEPVTPRPPLVARRHLSCSTRRRAQKGLISELG